MPILYFKINSKIHRVEQGKPFFLKNFINLFWKNEDSALLLPGTEELLYEATKKK